MDKELFAHQKHERKTTCSCGRQGTIICTVCKKTLCSYCHCEKEK